MNLNIVKFELKNRQLSILCWAIGIVFMIILTLGFYPSFKEQSVQLQKAFTNIPDSALSLLSDTHDFFSPVGYLSSQLFYAVLPMILGILGISLGSTLLAKEEKDSTIELILSRPISRTKLLFSKLMSGGLILSIIGSVLTLSLIIIVTVVDIEVSRRNIALTSAVCLLMTATFAMIAFLISVTGRTRVASIGIATMYALGGYIIGSLSGVVGWLKWPAKIFAFTYYKPAELLTSSYNWANTLFFIAIILFCGVISWIIFYRRDLTG